MKGFLLNLKIYQKVRRFKLSFSGILSIILWLVLGYYQAYINYDNGRVCACFVCNPRTCTELILQRLQSILAIQMTHRVAWHTKTCWYCWILKTISLLMHYVFLFIYIVYTRITKSWFYKKFQKQKICHTWAVLGSHPGLERCFPSQIHFLIWAFPSLFLDLFFSWYTIRLQSINFTMVIDDRKQERRRKSMHRSITRY